MNERWIWIEALWREEDGTMYAGTAPGKLKCLSGSPWFAGGTGDPEAYNAQGFRRPAIHWNTYLGMYVMTRNRMPDAGFAAEGVYISFNRRLSDRRGSSWIGLTTEGPRRS